MKHRVPFIYSLTLSLLFFQAFHPLQASVLADPKQRFHRARPFFFASMTALNSASVCS
jgi:hypothetical protein